MSKSHARKLRTGKIRKPPAGAVYTWFDDMGQRWFGTDPHTTDKLKIEGRTLQRIKP